MMEQIRGIPNSFRSATLCSSTHEAAKVALDLSFESGVELGLGGDVVGGGLDVDGHVDAHRVKRGRVLD